MLKSWIIYILGLAGALVFHAYYFGWYSWFVLQLMILLPMLSLVISLPAMLSARLQIELQPACTQCEAAYVSVRLAGSRLPLPQCRLRLQVTHTMTGERQVLKNIITGTDQWYVKLDTAHVGQLCCTAKRVRIYDYLRLFRMPVRGCGRAALVVFPEAREPKVLPNLSRFRTKQLRPKPGGGFSEEHEMRQYREGDRLRDIHWKLSVKTDSLIVREAQEPLRGEVLLTLDLAGTQAQIDSVLCSFCWLSKWLLEHDTPHRITWIDPEDCQLASMEITHEGELRQVLERLLCSGLRPDTPSVAQRRFDRVDWRYHILPEQEVAP